MELDLTPAGWRLSAPGMALVSATPARHRTSAHLGTTALCTAAVPLQKAQTVAAALLRILADPVSTEAS